MDSYLKPEIRSILNDLPMRIAIAAAASVADHATETGTTREIFAALSTLLTGAKLLRHNSLVQSVFDEYKRDGQGEARILSLSHDPPDNLIPRSLEDARTAAGALDALPDRDAVLEFKLWLRGIAAEIVSSSQTGGFLGIGGTVVTEEGAYLDHLTAALGIELPST